MFCQLERVHFIPPYCMKLLNDPTCCTFSLQSVLQGTYMGGPSMIILHFGRSKCACSSRHQGPELNARVLYVTILISKYIIKLHHRLKVYFIFWNRTVILNVVSDQTNPIKLSLDKQFMLFHQKASSEQKLKTTGVVLEVPDHVKLYFLKCYLLIQNRKWEREGKRSLPRWQQ